MQRERKKRLERYLQRPVWPYFRELVPQLPKLLWHHSNCGAHGKVGQQQSVGRKSVPCTLEKYALESLMRTM